MEGKRSRINNTTDLIVDRISDLPDFILGHILSFLPTNKAVATSILSKRWKFVWMTVHSLDFFNSMDVEDEEEDDEEVDEEDKEKIMEFVRFVNRVLLLNGSGSLNKFSLTCYLLSITPQIISWINTAITRNVHHLYLSVGGDHHLPATSSLFSCDSLRSLDLYGFVSIHDTTAICLPRLESLQIDHVRFESKEAFEKLISGCPILHNLNLVMQDWTGDAHDDFTYIISSDSLRRLGICFDNRNKLKLKASSLEYLRLSGFISEIFVEKSLSSLVEAYFNIHLDEHDLLNNSIVEAVRAFDCAKFLTLSADVMQALRRATISLSTEFNRLVKLVAATYCCPLQDFIQSSENLEELICQLVERRSKWPRNPRWATVPRCLSKSLKKVYFRSYNGAEDERDMICYILKHGSVLEVMHISCNKKGGGEKLMLLKEISEFPRKSPVCKVQFF